MKFLKVEQRSKPFLSQFWTCYLWKWNLQAFSANFYEKPQNYKNFSYAVVLNLIKQVFFLIFFVNIDFLWITLIYQAFQPFFIDKLRTKIIFSYLKSFEIADCLEAFRKGIFILVIKNFSANLFWYTTKKYNFFLRKFVCISVVQNRERKSFLIISARFCDKNNINFHISFVN